MDHPIGPKGRLYYELHPYNQKDGKIVTPVDSEKTITRLLLTRPEAEALIQEIPQIKEMTVANDKPPALAGGNFYIRMIYSMVVPASPVRLSSALSREVMIALRPFPASKKFTEAETFGSMEANSNCPWSIYAFASSMVI